MIREVPLITVRGASSDVVGALEALSPPSFISRAVCAQTDPEAFFPEKGESVREAKRVCASCEVRLECLEYALANNERFGVWGGMSERERRAILAARRERRAA